MRRAEGGSELNMLFIVAYYAQRVDIQGIPGEPIDKSVALFDEDGQPVDLSDLPAPLARVTGLSSGAVSYLTATVELPATIRITAPGAVTALLEPLSSYVVTFDVVDDEFAFAPIYGLVRMPAVLAPVLITPIPDLTGLTEDTGVYTYPVATNFANAGGGLWALPVTVPGVTINQAGAVIIDTGVTGALNAVPISVQVGNSMGTATGNFLLTVAFFASAPAISSLTITGLPQVGETLGFSLATTGAPAPDVIAVEWRRAGVPIPGETLPTYTVTSSDNTAALTVKVTVQNPSGTATAISAPVTVLYAPPTAVGTIPLQQFTEGTGVQTVNLNPYFDYIEGGTWSLPTTITGVTVLSSGTLRIDTDVTGDTDGTILKVRYENSGGRADQTLQLKIILATTAPQIHNLEIVTDGLVNIGDTLGVDAVVSGQPAPEIAYRWRLNGINISGATLESYLVTPADDGGSLTVRVTATNIAGSVVATSAAVIPVYKAPTVAGAVPAQYLVDDTGVYTLDVAPYVNDAVGGAWSIPTPLTGVSVNSSGAVSFDTDAMVSQSGTSLAVVYTNSGGMATVTISVTVGGEWDIRPVSNGFDIYAAPFGESAPSVTTDPAGINVNAA